MREKTRIRREPTSATPVATGWSHFLVRKRLIQCCRGVGIEIVHLPDEIAAYLGDGSLLFVPRGCSSFFQRASHHFVRNQLIHHPPWACRGERWRLIPCKAAIYLSVLPIALHNSICGRLATRAGGSPFFTTCSSYSCSLGFNCTG